MIDFSKSTVFDQLRNTTAGLDTYYPVVDPNIAESVLDTQSREGQISQTYLDSTATTLGLSTVEEARRSIEGNYANSHSSNSIRAAISTQALEDARGIISRFINAPASHSVIFLGNGTTAAINRLARTIFRKDYSDYRDLVLYSGMEHHANILPWRENAPRADYIPINPHTGLSELNALHQKLKQHEGHVRLVALTGTSNVTGLMPNITDAATLAHQYGAEILIDAAQMLAHHPIDMMAAGIDYLAFSGHKTYAPGSNGVLVMPHVMSNQIPDEVGGGIVTLVTHDQVIYSTGPERQEAGTPNIIGSVMLAAAIQTLANIGMNRVWEHELKLTAALLDPKKGLPSISGVTVLGSIDLKRHPRAGVVTSKMDGLYHAIVSRAMSDYFAISTRDGCFCAHPYLMDLHQLPKEELAGFIHMMQTSPDLSKIPGGVRASLGVYSNEVDIQRYINATRWISKNRDRLNNEYSVDTHGNAIRHDGWAPGLTHRSPFKHLLKTSNGETKSRTSARRVTRTAPLTTSRFKS